MRNSIRLVSILFCWILAVLSVNACASTEAARPNFVRVTGVVTAPSGEPVSGAVVSTIPATISAVSASDGQFVLNNLNSPGEYVVVAVHDSTSNQPGRQAIRANWGSQHVDITLGVDSLDLENKDKIADPDSGRGRKTTEGG